MASNRMSIEIVAEISQLRDQLQAANAELARHKEQVAEVGTAYQGAGDAARAGLADGLERVGTLSASAAAAANALATSLTAVSAASETAGKGVQDLGNRTNDQRKAAQEWQSTQAKLAQMGVQQEITGLEAQVTTRQISADQRYATERSLNERLVELQAESLQQEMATQQAGSAAAVATYDKILVAYQIHTGKMAAISRQEAVAEARDADQAATLVGRSLTSVLTGRQTVTQLAMSLGEQLLQKELTNVYRSVEAAFAGDQAKTASRTASAAEGKAAEAEAGSATVLGDANKAAAGAFSAVAQIPFVGPFLAPAAAAAAFAAVAAYDVFSAAGGYDIPAGVNPLTQLHAREMVLPARHADTIRALSGALDGPRLAYVGLGAGGGFPASPATASAADLAQLRGGGDITLNQTINHSAGRGGAEAESLYAAAARGGRRGAIAIRRAVRR